MPELPEVEVVKKTLESQIKNLIIKNIEIIDKNLRYKVKKQSIKKILGLKVIKIKRRSKYLLFLFNKNLVMIVHLGMTGKFFFVKNDLTKRRTSFYYNTNDYKEKHNRIIFILSKNMKLIYNDIRKFGFIKVLFSSELKKEYHLKTLGPEPLGKNYNFKYFRNYLIGKKKKIKDLLMDQKFISGLGNIYVNEILFLSKIKPDKNVNILNDKEIKNIISNTKKILKKAIIFGGSSIKNFSNSSGKKGNFQEMFSVYGRLGYKCSNSDCKGIIKKMLLSNRSSFFCPICQK
tara:strand:+ start:765 stop:1631 length:867 start_codon:yes stop_codon:yes gene_type:complete